MTLQHKVLAAQNGDISAFTNLVESHQNLVLGYAFAQLGDFQVAQDVVQESFAIAFDQIRRLKDPEAFAPWLKGIVHHRCHRVFRQKHRHWQPIEDREGPSDMDLDKDLQRAQERRLLLQAIRELPQDQRMVVTLYYLEEQSQKAVAEFLEIPLTRVNNYLHEARQQLKGRLLEMAGSTFKDQRLSEEFAKNIGEIISAQGPLVEAKIKKSHKASVFDTFGSQSKDKAIGPDLLVVQRLNDGRFRCVSTGDQTPQQGKILGVSQIRQDQGALPEERIKQAVAQMAPGGDKAFVETGIKAIDLFCPMVNGGGMGIFGREGVGRAVFIMELLQGRQRILGDLNLFFFVDRWHILGTQDLLDSEFRGELGYSSDINENIQTAWIVHDRAGDPNYAKAADYLESRVYFSPLKAIQNLWPAIDPLHSHSSAFTEEALGAEHFDLGMKAREVLGESHKLMFDPKLLELMALGARHGAKERSQEFSQQRLKELSESERLFVSRAQRMERFLTQPFNVAEDFSGKKGVRVSLGDTLSGTRKILEGQMDSEPLDSLTFVGSI